MRPKGITIILKHPKVDGGVMKYSTDDGWDMMLFVGKKEGNQYHMSRMVASDGHIVDQAIESLMRDYPNIVLPIVVSVHMENIAKENKELLKPIISTNDTTN